MSVDRVGVVEVVILPNHFAQPKQASHMGSTPSNLAQKTRKSNCHVVVQAADAIADPKSGSSSGPLTILRVVRAAGGSRSGSSSRVVRAADAIADQSIEKNEVVSLIRQHAPVEDRPFVHRNGAF